MQLPKAKVSGRWLISNAKATAADLRFLKSDSNGEYEVVACNPGEIEDMRAELVRYRTLHEDRSDVLVKYGDKLAILLENLSRKITRKEFRDLCVLLSQCTLADIRHLYRGWNLRKPPGQLFQLMARRREETGSSVTPEYIIALSLLDLAAKQGQVRLLR